MHTKRNQKMVSFELCTQMLQQLQMSPQDAAEAIGMARSNGGRWVTSGKITKTAHNAIKYLALKNKTSSEAGNTQTVLIIPVKTQSKEHMHLLQTLSFAKIPFSQINTGDLE